MPKLKAKAHFDQGLALFHKKQLDKAAELFREAILEEPNYPEALYNLACCYAMLGQRDNALVYLDRSIKLDLKCLDWAGQDMEFDSIREDEAFVQVLESNDPFKPSEEEAEVDSDDEGSDTQEAEGFEEMDVEQLESVDGAVPAEGAKSSDELPPCPQCEALVEEMRLPRFDPFLSLAVTGLGVILAITWLVYPRTLLFGIPLICLGLWMLTRMENTWVCQNCGARGEAAGQPPKT